MKLSNNLSLPTLPLFAARSTWAILIAALITLANMWGIDLLGFLTSIGAGGSPEEVLATGERVIGAWQTVAPLVLGVWAWIERRAPNFRLVFWNKVTDDDSGLHLLGLIAVVLACLGSSGRPALAESVPCTSLAELTAMLTQQFGESPAAAGVLADGQHIIFLANLDTGTWTAVVVLTADQPCPVAAGRNWVAYPLPPPGNPA